MAVLEAQKQRDTIDDRAMVAEQARVIGPGLDPDGRRVVIIGRLQVVLVDQRSAILL